MMWPPEAPLLLRLIKLSDRIFISIAESSFIMQTRAGGVLALTGPSTRRTGSKKNCFPFCLTDA